MTNVSRPRRKEAIVKKLLALLLLTSSTDWSQQVTIGREVNAQVSLCPDQKAAEAVLTTHAAKGLLEARKVYSEKCLSAVVLVTPQAVVSEIRVEGVMMRVVKVLVRMQDESQTEWFMLTNLPIAKNGVSV